MSSRVRRETAAPPRRALSRPGAARAVCKRRASPAESSTSTAIPAAEAAKLPTVLSVEKTSSSSSNSRARSASASSAWCNGASACEVARVASFTQCRPCSAFRLRWSAPILAYRCPLHLGPARAQTHSVGGRPCCGRAEQIPRFHHAAAGCFVEQQPQPRINSDSPKA